jgi:hypothetical protein
MSDADCKLQSETLTSGPRTTVQRGFALLAKLNAPIVPLLLLAGAAFLARMCYLGLAFNLGFGVVFLGIVYLYARTRHGIRIPLPLLGLVFAALQVDALGNHFHLYGHMFGPMQYDEFSHLMVQVLVSPIIVWLVSQALEKWGYQLPIGLTAFFAGTTVFSLSAAYEIIELWDELYLGGQRIWSKYDSATDLQWDLCGIVVGTLLACLLSSRTRAIRTLLPLRH